jgi:hypothetical protein
VKVVDRAGSLIEHVEHDVEWKSGIALVREEIFEIGPDAQSITITYWLPSTKLWRTIGSAGCGTRFSSTRASERRRATDSASSTSYTLSATVRSSSRSIAAAPWRAGHD